MSNHWFWYHPLTGFRRPEENGATGSKKSATRESGKEARAKPRAKQGKHQGSGRNGSTDHPGSTVQVPTSVALEIACSAHTKISMSPPGPVQQLEQRQTRSETGRIRNNLRDTKILVIPRLGNNAQNPPANLASNDGVIPNKHMRGRR